MPLLEPSVPSLHQHVLRHVDVSSRCSKVEFGMFAKRGNNMTHCVTTALGFFMIHALRIIIYETFQLFETTQNLRNAGMP